MDHLDLADVLSSPWLPPYGQSGDPGGYLTRVMLEPIMEESSEDDENGAHELWSQYEHAWSSESETGSVIRVGFNQGMYTYFDNLYLKLMSRLWLVYKNI